jgi:hypothetical protein
MNIIVLRYFFYVGMLILFDRKLLNKKNLIKISIYIILFLTIARKKIKIPSLFVCYRIRTVTGSAAKNGSIW